MQLSIYIFSFNRGAFLENCIASIKACAGDCAVTIIDDRSKDPHTIDVLKNLSARYRIVQASDDSNENSQGTVLGGLYGNMNLAMKDAIERDFKRVLFIQDDMQFVRPLTDRDFKNLDDYLQANKNTFQISTTFVRSLSQSRFDEKHFLDDSRTAYLRHPATEGGKSNFCDTGVFDVERFRLLFKDFVVTEGANSDKARSLGLCCGRSVYPFMNWLPYPVAHRGKRGSILFNLLEKIGGSGYYPIEQMQNSEIDELLSRDPLIPPIMEQYLSSPTSPRQDIWSTGGGEYNLRARYDWAAPLIDAAKSAKRSLFGRRFGGFKCE